MNRLLLTATVLAMTPMSAVADPPNSHAMRSSATAGTRCRTWRTISARCPVRTNWALVASVISALSCSPNALLKFRRQTVRQAIDALIWKATHGKRLPDTPVCGA